MSLLDLYFKILYLYDYILFPYRISRYKRDYAMGRKIDDARTSVTFIVGLSISTFYRFSI